MPSRSQIKIRRDVRRSRDLCKKHEAANPMLKLLAVLLAEMYLAIEAKWRAWVEAVINGKQERTERTDAVGDLLGWVQTTRPVLLFINPAAADSLRQLPAGAATPDDLIAVAKDLKHHIETNPKAESIRATALETLGDLLDVAEKETAEAADALLNETATRDELTDTMLEANRLLVRSLDVIRAHFGADSREYRQFMARDTSQEEDEDDDILFPGQDAA